MLLTSTYYSHMRNQHYATHSPIQSSPLRERSVNTGAGLFDFNAMSQQNEKQPQQPQRAYKANPVVQMRDATTKRRRELFLKRVQNNREDKKWESRGEQLQQLDFVSERKRWESKKAQEAPPEEDEFDDELLSYANLPQSSSNAPQYEPEMSEADYVLAQEEHELQQLIAALEQEQSQDKALQQYYGSDDEDYDQIFMCTADVNVRYQQEPRAHDSSYRDIDEMDMTDD
ncbi:uncharacterized protein M421DRAFT_151462 [Didymella exigua CBS 183.55]|uniref:Uncharacterized protein n=1 Tax=Didymella exigua CBS 183.55 TaxID=1150837 RepID=A0A6A5RLW2_9PLEO|nr:uncharacterized protein M421DRAFT_151462 [Didymella exigua CBS 183.55]KAF1928649.1 hypothetical protein M421DRAFT_151462 [Didymella exigua CBS 183.55]